MQQLELSLPARRSSGWGGKRAGSGRKAGPGRPCVPHRERPEHRSAQPVHATLRSSFRGLRTQRVFPILRSAMSRLNRRKMREAHAAGVRSRFRVVHFSVQTDHVHLVVEAEDKRELLRGMQGLAVSIARKINQLLSRRGRLWADRWHGRALTCPRAVRNALVYVMANHRKHGHASVGLIDPYSSAPYFTGFAGFNGQPPILLHPSLVPKALAPPVVLPVAAPSRWLLAVGWKRHGLLRLHEKPLAPKRAELI
jgi:REP element-mobilizing transposase RayT